MIRNATSFSRREIRKLATEYASTDYNVSHLAFEDDYNVSTATFYNLLNNAVIRGIVDDSIVYAMEEKSKSNASKKAGEKARKRSEKHYNNLREKRKTYQLPKKEAIEITTRYAESSLKKETFADTEVMTTALLGRTILRCITNNWVDDKTVKELEKKSLKRYDNPETVDFWNRIWNIRKYNKEAQG